MHFISRITYSNLFIIVLIHLIIGVERVENIDTHIFDSYRSYAPNGGISLGINGHHLLPNLFRNFDTDFDDHQQEQPIGHEKDDKLTAEFQRSYHNYPQRVRISQQKSHQHQHHYHQSSHKNVHKRSLPSASSTINAGKPNITTLRNNNDNKFKLHESLHAQHQQPQLNRTVVQIRNRNNHTNTNQLFGARFNQTYPGGNAQNYTVHTNNTHVWIVWHKNFTNGTSPQPQQRYRQNGMFLNRSAISSNNRSSNIGGRIAANNNNTNNNIQIGNHGKEITYINIPNTSRWRNRKKRSIDDATLMGKKSLQSLYETSDIQFTVEKYKRKRDNTGEEDKNNAQNIAEAATVAAASTTTAATSSLNTQQQQQQSSSATTILQKLSTTPLMFGRISVRRVFQRGDHIVDNDNDNDKTLNIVKPIKEENNDVPDPLTVLIQVPQRKPRCRPNQRVALGLCRSVW